MMEHFLPIFVKLFFLLILLNYVICELTINCEHSDGRFVLQIDQPFEVTCTVSGTDQLHGTIEWLIDDIPVNRTLLTVTNSKEGSALTSTLYGARVPSDVKTGQLLYFKIIYKVGNEETDTTLPFAALKGTAFPTPEVGNGTDKSVVVGTFNRKVVLPCMVTFNNTESLPTSFEVKGITISWTKDNTVLQSNTIPYKTKKSGIQRYAFNYTTVVTSSNKGGLYTCQARWEMGTQKKNKNYRSASTQLNINLYLPDHMKEKEVKKTAGDDVDLVCDIVGYPITYKWLDENGNDYSNKKDSRIQINDNVLKLEDIDYDDRKEYICRGELGVIGNTIIEQTIILRVKDRLAALWPFIGIVIQAIIIALIIVGAYYYKKRQRTDADDKETFIEPADTSTTVN